MKTRTIACYLNTTPKQRYAVQEIADRLGACPDETLYRFIVIPFEHGRPSILGIDIAGTDYSITPDGDVATCNHNG